MSPEPTAQRRPASIWTSVIAPTAFLAVLLPVLVAAAPAHARPERSATASSDSTHQAAQQKKFPSAGNSGTPKGWQPKRTVNGDHVVTKAGAVVRDLRIYGDLVIDAPDVLVERVEVLGGRINNVPEDQCFNGLVIKKSTITRSDDTTEDTDEPVIGIGGYTARDVEINNVPEGFRVGGDSMGCGPVKIVNTFVRVVPPDVCNDWHGDGIQGYDGPALTVRNVTLILVETGGCGGTAPFFYPHSQGNTRADIDRLLVVGGGYAFRLGTPGTVTGLKIARDSWYYGPIDVNCSALSSWEAQIVTMDGNQPVDRRTQRCNSNGGG